MGFGIIFIIILIIIVFVILMLALCSKDDNESNTKNNYTSTSTSYTQKSGESFWERTFKPEYEKFGEYGENVVADCIEECLKNKKHYLFNNFTFMDDQGYSSNIDHILITKAGVFIIETKSYKGEIYETDNEDYWYNKKEEHQEDKCIKNPIKQNMGHINHLKKILGKNAPKMYSVIIFPFVDYIDIDDGYVYKLEEAMDYIVEKTDQEKYSDEYVDKMTNVFRNLIDTYGITPKMHKENIEKLYK